jgi:hypothetical protein
MAGEAIGPSISRSFKRTGLILFKPFSLKKWLCLLFIAWLSGSLGYGGMSFNVPSPHKFPKRKAHLLPDASHESSPEVLLCRQDYSRPRPPGVKQSLKRWYYRGSGLAKPILAFIIGVVVFFALAVIAVLSWLCARFKFIWFRSVAANDASIASPFREYREEGNSLFALYIMLFLLFWAFLGGLAYWVYRAGVGSGVFGGGAEWTLVKVLNIFVFPIMLFAAGILLMVLVYVCIDHFVVPIMALQRCRFSPAWRKFLEILKDNWKDFFLYLLVLIGLGIAAGMMVLIAAIFCVLAIVVAGLVVFGIPFLLLVSLLQSKLLYLVVVVILGVPFAVISIALMASINLPVAVFFRCFSLYFLSGLRCGYAPLPLDS